MKIANGSALWTYLLTNNTFLIADLYTITLRLGVGTDATKGIADTVIKWTMGDTDLGAFVCNAPPITRSGVRQARGGEVSTMDLMLGGADYLLPNGKTLTQSAQEGYWDMADVKVERQFMPTWGDIATYPALTWFSGRVAGVSPSSTELKLTLKDRLDNLNLPFPKYVYQPGCGHDLFGTGCGLLRSAFLTTGTVLLVNQTQFQWADAHAAGYFTGGTCKMTSGAAKGQTRTVIDHFSVGGGQMRVTLALPFAADMAHGDAFELTPGCKKDLATCVTKFNNASRFRGFPSVPKPESIR